MKNPIIKNAIMKPRLSLILLLFSAATALAAAGAADWLSQVPPRDRQRANPFNAQPQAVEAGRLLYSDHCAQCHGKNAEGARNRPSLRSQRVQSDLSEGEVHWLLVNGNMRRGMPSWSKLPDQQLWQLVSYLRSLKPAERGANSN
jgi:mono/diheme cytochrome c family protein